MNHVVLTFSYLQKKAHFWDTTDSTYTILFSPGDQKHTNPLNFEYNFYFQFLLVDFNGMHVYKNSLP